MNNVRISKYIDNNYKENGDWTSISDIGKKFNNKILTRREYLSVENQYLNCVDKILLLSDQSYLTINSFEHYKRVPWKDNQKIEMNKINRFLRDCLREKCWARLIGNDFYLHIGYDFYLYIGTSLDMNSIVKIVKENNLFCEKMISPYLHIDKEDQS